MRFLFSLIILLCPFTARAARVVTSALNGFPVGFTGAFHYGHVCNVLNVGDRPQHVTFTGIGTNPTAVYDTKILPAPAAGTQANLVKPTVLMEPNSQILFSLDKDIDQPIRAVRIEVTEDRGAVAATCQMYYYGGGSPDFFYTTNSTAINGGRPF